MRKGPDGNGRERARIVAVELAGVVGISPGEEPAVGSARRLFPCGFRRQPPGPACLFAQPFGVSLCVLVTHHHHRMVRPIGRRPRRCPDIGLGPAERVDQPVAVPNLLGHRRRSMPGIGQKRGIGRVGHRRLHDRVAVELDRFTRFAFVPAAFARYAVTIGGLVEPVSRFALGTFGVHQEGTCRNLDHVDRACRLRKHGTGDKQAGYHSQRGLPKNGPRSGNHPSTSPSECAWRPAPEPVHRRAGGRGNRNIRR